jgi:hypothetical protein
MRVQDPITGDMSWIYPTQRRFRKFVISFMFVLVSVTIVVCSVLAVIIVRVRARCTVTVHTLNSDGADCGLWVQQFGRGCGYMRSVHIAAAVGAERRVDCPTRHGVSEACQMVHIVG